MRICLKAEPLSRNYIFLDSCALVLDALFIHHTRHRLFSCLNIQLAGSPMLVRNQLSHRLSIVASRRHF